MNIVEFECKNGSILIDAHKISSVRLINANDGAIVDKITMDNHDVHNVYCTKSVFLEKIGEPVCENLVRGR